MAVSVAEVTLEKMRTGTTQNGGYSLYVDLSLFFFKLLG
jgi:hypothetical protein